jgi:hypothetical protein
MLNTIGGVHWREEGLWRCHVNLRLALGDVRMGDESVVHTLGRRVVDGRGFGGVYFDVEREALCPFSVGTLGFRFGNGTMMRNDCGRGDVEKEMIGMHLISPSLG